MDDEQIIEHNKSLIQQRMLNHFQQELAKTQFKLAEAIAKNQILVERNRELEKIISNQDGAAPTGGFSS
ncbi:hypothetical protein RN04_03580 [Arthrobacter sp. W1]|nr:hypothetical protein RN04_03580 [Arthrobacter sp. W1]